MYEARERLVEIEHAHVAHSLCKEPCIEQVHACVLGAADVLVDRAELVDLLAAEHL